jgi:hypothetical protein
MNDWTRRNNANAMGRTLAEFVRTHYPADGETVVLDEEDPDGFSLVRITATDGAWSTGSISSVEYLTYERLNSSIATKDHKVAEYRAHLAAHAQSTSQCISGWQVWLLLATRLPVLWSMSCPPEVRSWHFASDFDRVFLASWEYGVLRINISNT